MAPANKSGERGVELKGEVMKYSMAFGYNDVDYIVVPKQYKSKIQQLIKELGQSIEVKIYENEVEIDKIKY